MGLSHKKRLRRHVEFYRTAFGFHEPLKVRASRSYQRRGDLLQILIDGNFLHQMQRLK